MSDCGHLEQCGECKMECCMACLNEECADCGMMICYACIDKHECEASKK